MTRRLLLILAALTLASVLPSAAWAKSNRIYFWGVQRGCTPNPDLAREVEKRLTILSSDIVTLAPDPKRLGCQGAACATQLTRECQGVAAQGGKLLGVIVEPGKGVHKIRIWLHDLEAGVTAYKDEYCQGCTLLSSLPPMVSAFVEQASFTDGTPGLTPTYCQKAAASASAPAVSKIHLVLSADLKHRAAVAAAIKQRMQSIGIEPLSSHADSGALTLAELTKMTSKEPGSQVLVVDGKAGGKIEVSLFDGTTQRTEGREIDCQHCDKDELLVQVKGVLNALLAHCFGDQCGSSTSAERVPPEACQPFQILRCGGGEEAASSGALADPSATQGRAPTSPTGKLARNLLWGLFGVGAATSVGLLIANYSGAGTLNGTSDRTGNVLAPAAGVAGGLSLLMLGVAIPVTISAARESSAGPSAAASASPGEPAQSRQTSSLPPLSCPK